MTARILRLPRTPAGRTELRDALSGSADFRAYLVEEFDWDASAVEGVRLGLADYPPEALRAREVR